jgi:hypothetical protein
MRWLGIWRINRDSIDFKWGYFARWALQFVVHRGGYFDQRWAVSIALGWGLIHFYLPFKTKLGEGCSLPDYGFAIHNDMFWIYTGGDYDESIGQTQGRQWISWNLPFFSYVFDGHWVKDKNLSWVKMTDDLRPWDFRKDQAYIEKHPYTYTLREGTIQHRIATCSIEKRKWHRKWFPFLTKVSQVIDVDFSDEVGERTGSWKGGTVSCGYEMLPDETIEMCLCRMEMERKF